MFDLHRERFRIRPGILLLGLFSLFLTSGAALPPPADGRGRPLTEGSPSKRLGPLVPVDLVTAVGVVPPGSPGDPVIRLEFPTINGNGEVGFTGAVLGTDFFVWFDTGIVWLNSSAPPGTVLTFGVWTMGVGPNGQFIYNPFVNDASSVWTHNGLLLKAQMPAPGFPAGTLNTFNSNATMDRSGQAYWIAGFNDAGGNGRVLYRSPDVTLATTTVVLRSDDLVGGIPIARPDGVTGTYEVSDNSAHLIMLQRLATGSFFDDNIVYVDGTMVAREGSPSGDGDNWNSFASVTINDAGDYLFTGNTDGAPTSDAFIARNGAIVVREGDVLSGITLNNAAVNALTSNNLGQAAFIWTVGSKRFLFGACDSADLLGTSRRLLAVGDRVDVDGNGTVDARVADLHFLPALSCLTMTEEGVVYLEVGLNFGHHDLEAIIGVAGPNCPGL